ncbi:hypothetical protein [Paenibacillus tuaregi]|uniref:hypothetical protein n=1 Tax=Paenibacillus tuaregi TaxID=1816681 RepID=UPI000837CB30|nr:hypothetical protein [Paenibacillus tuaregi]
MSNETKRLQLKIPDLYHDEFYQFVMDLASNFQTIDDHAEEYADSVPVTGQWPLKQRLWNTNPSIGGYIGWVNTRAGTAANKWESLKPYKNGDLVVPHEDNGHVYQCIQTGYSGLKQPVFPVAIDAEVQDTNQAGVWQASKYYEKDELVFPTLDNGRFYVCIQAGESGDTEPSWLTNEGATTYDKNAVWASYRIAKWKEAGVSCLFRPFGMIE